jgi:hypothetical protein
MNRTVNQNTCNHDAKVKMAGYNNRSECTRCHKFIINTLVHSQSSGQKPCI